MKEKFINWLHSATLKEKRALLGDFHPPSLAKCMLGKLEPKPDWLEAYASFDGTFNSPLVEETTQSIHELVQKVADKKEDDEKQMVKRIEEKIAASTPVFKEMTEPAKGFSSSGEWEGKDVRILFPCMKTTNPVTAANLFALALDFGPERIGFDLELGDSMIYNSRNKLAQRFLDTGANWSFWVDDDIIFPIGRPEFTRKHTGNKDLPDKVLEVHTLKKLLTHQKSLVGGCYFGRRSPAPPMFGRGMTDEYAMRMARNMQDELIDTDWCATGCLLVHRQVYIDILDKFPELRSTDPEKPHNWFLPMNGKGEDVAFCERAAAAGHQCFVDLGVQCMHVGYQCYHALNTSQIGYE